MDKRAIDTLLKNQDHLQRVYDKIKDPKLVKKMDIRIVVADPEWQRIRSGFVGTWNKKLEENTEVLRQYVDDMSDPYKVRRVLNYLTGSAFRIGVIQSESISRLRDEIRKRWEQMTT